MWISLYNASHPPYEVTYFLVQSHSVIQLKWVTTMDCHHHRDFIISREVFNLQLELFFEGVFKVIYLLHDYDYWPWIGENGAHIIAKEIQSLEFHHTWWLEGSFMLWIIVSAQAIPSNRDLVPQLDWFCSLFMVDVKWDIYIFESFINYNPHRIIFDRRLVSIESSVIILLAYEHQGGLEFHAFALLTLLPRIAIQVDRLFNSFE